MANIAIIGGGAAGMAAAIRAAENKNNRVVLLERQARVGRKLLSTGNGRCNLTNMLASPADYHGERPDFILPAFRAYPPEKVLEFFASLGLMTTQEHGGRVYPMSNHAASVLDVLRLGMEARNVELICGAAVEQVSLEKGRFRIQWADGSLTADKIIIACGGAAGSKLGGVMDGYKLLQSLGHSRTALYPALTQIRTKPDYPRAMKGIKVDAPLRLYKGKALLGEFEGDILFTETGVSGTAAFALSRLISTAGEGLELSVDFFPATAQVALTGHLKARIAALPDLPANQIFTGTVHSRVGQMLCKCAGISGGDSAGAISGPQLTALAVLAKDFRLPVTGVSGFESAQVTAGGIKTSEFDPRTLESRLVPGLFACGEVLDIDGDCGGFNLQWAWASGLLAGRLGL